MEISFLTIVISAVAFLVVLWLVYKFACYKTDLKWQSQLVALRKDIADSQRANIKGKVAETFAPFMEGFPFSPSECKFLGDPIDYVVFEGLNERNIKGIHFVEVKNNTAKMSKHQKQIKDLVDSINDDKVTFKEFRLEQ